MCTRSADWHGSIYTEDWACVVDFMPKPEIRGSLCNPYVNNPNALALDAASVSINPGVTFDPRVQNVGRVIELVSKTWISPTQSIHISGANGYGN